MRSQFRTLCLLSIAALLLFLAGCASQGLEVQSIPISENPSEQIRILEQEVNKGRRNQLNVLAPSWFDKAEASLASAKKGFEAGRGIEDIFELLAEGRAQIKQAEEIAELVRFTIPEAIKARERARTAGATSFEQAYAELEEEFRELTRAIEDDRLQFAQRKAPGVADGFDQLELKAIKENTIGEVERLIRQAETEGAEELAPAMLAKAKKQLSEADEFITRHRYEQQTMQDKANAALFQAQRLLEITRQSRELQGMEPESTCLWVEGILHRTTLALGASDMRNQPFDTQVENILGSIESLQKDHDFMVDRVKVQQSRIEDLKEKIATLEGRSKAEQAARERLAAEKRFNQRFNEVSGFFTQNEAEVYKQGRNLVIRLSGIQFPVGKHIILPDNYGLLSKVQRAIRTFGEPEITIEGHTDSTGSDQRNDLLSQQRAEAVRQYLLANEILPGAKITAVGFGSKRPLASNETAEGRAINRRIDVVVSPPASDTF